MSATVCSPVMRSLSSLGPTVTFTLKREAMQGHVSPKLPSRSHATSCYLCCALNLHIVEEIGPAMPSLKRLVEMDGSVWSGLLATENFGQRYRVISISAQVRNTYLGYDFVVICIMRAAIAARVDPRSIQVLFEKPSHPSPCDALVAELSPPPPRRCVSVLPPFFVCVAS